VDRLLRFAYGGQKDESSLRLWLLYYPRKVSLKLSDALTGRKRG